jgi:hypothetical protein
MIRGSPPLPSRNSLREWTASRDFSPDLAEIPAAAKEISEICRQPVHLVARLRDRWVEAWPRKLKPKLQLGEFEAQQPNWWQDIDIRKYDGYWGGEIAGAGYTNYLRPEEMTLYLPKGRVLNILRDARLRKAQDWNRTDTNKIHIYERFWPKTTENLDKGYEEEKGLVHPILAYADLMATGDPRNLETARKLYERHIDGQFIPED